jgi:DNA/RNA endonuclease G (NUC1)
MLEMAGSRSEFIKDTMYVYNMANDSADSYLNRERQLELEKYIRSNANGEATVVGRI